MDTKEKILDAAMRLFSQKGYLGATTREIAKEAGIAEVTIFRQFASKENLYKEVMRRCSFLPVLKEMMPEVRKMRYDRALCLIGERFIHSLEQKKDMIKIIYSEVHTYPARIHEMHEAMTTELWKTLAGYFEELQRKGVMAEFDARFAARAFIGMLYSYFIGNEFKREYRPEAADTRAVIAQYVRLFTEGTRARTRRDK